MLRADSSTTLKNLSVLPRLDNRRWRSQGMNIGWVENSWTTCTLQGWLKSHPMWRVVIPVGKHEDAFIVYRNTLFRRTKEIHCVSAQHEPGKRGRTRRSVRP